MQKLVTKVPDRLKYNPWNRQDHQLAMKLGTVLRTSLQQGQCKKLKLKYETIFQQNRWNGQGSPTSFQTWDHFKKNIVGAGAMQKLATEVPNCLK